MRSSYGATIVAMELTPEVFEKAEFDERRRGYDIDQVETFLEETGTALARLLVQVRKNEERLGQADATLAEADSAIEDARKRADQAERQLRAAETRIASLEEELAELREAAAVAPAQPAESSAAIDQEIKQATSTLVMAKRTAESAIREAQVQAEALLESARSESEQQLGAARSEAAEIVVDARRRAEEEFGARKSELVTQIADLQSKRDAEQVSLAAVESQLIDRYADLDRLINALSELRNATGLDLGDHGSSEEEVAGDLGNDQLAADLPVEETVATHDDAESDTAHADADSSVQVEAEYVNDDDLIDAEIVEAELVDADVAEEPGGPQDNADNGAETTDEDADDAAGTTRSAPQGFDVVDLTGEVEAISAGEDESWAPGSWAALEERLEDEGEIDLNLDESTRGDRDSGRSASQATATRTRASTRTAPAQQQSRIDISDDELEKTQAVPVADAAPRDRFLQELDSAVNEAVPYDEDDEAMKAFFEGSTDSKSRRFGWRR